VCGICGIFRISSDAPAPDPGELARTSAALAPRGPDGAATWESADGRLQLGHRRLAILDLSPSGAQPMTSADGRFTIVYNGEIYNYRELRERLSRSGAGLRSTSDTEVILELWRRNGVRALEQLRGMYAFALWDELTGELALARDPYGIKPLYYSCEGGTLRFASQVRALEAGGGISLAIDPAGVAGFLAWGAVPEPLTLRRAVRALPAGHWAHCGGEGPLRIEAVPFVTREAAPREVATALEESVRAHLVSDVPVALFLSAGLDSALVAALAVRRGGDPPAALTLTWDEVRGTGEDEEPLARATAAALGLRHVVREISGADVRAALPAILAAMDQPSIDGFNTWLVARLAREEGFKVALSGLGGDELFGGYDSFRDVPRWHRSAAALGRVPGLAAAWPTLARRFARDRPKLTRLLRYGDSLAGAYVLRRAVYLPGEIDELLAGAGLADGERRAYDAPLDTWERLGEETLGGTERLLADPWRAVHRLESSLYLRHQLLRDADWAGMAHGVEIRVPLVDPLLRDEMEARGFEPARSGGKAAVVATVAPELPGALFARQKSGFQLPIEDWLAGGRARPSQSAGGKSRRLALRVLESFGVTIPPLRSRTLR
jgi:asparagine synthase (glutamine-hydrolysing)